MLVTAKNHDLKAEVMTGARPEDWLFALVSLQTMAGYGGSTLYGISRMNSGRQPPGTRHSAWSATGR